ncbi:MULTISPECIES: dihydropteroate synthase [Nitrosomonas]|uniref:dihydropteroate synthase n=1 Tax=Nitrosomonas TaxID=914 RepID=UPI000793B9FB|nr:MULTISPECIES: dihydropteroate synthase [Nitrosomonas]KXK48961.1 MAG: dihydropteroate synthase [Nitrosomonas europaea]MBV6390116.1 Dihydropteroate synthase [Nitrosomonas europaea]MEB2331605.1 dihydropteroate synthase [Nitrosomonas sp.]
MGVINVTPDSFSDGGYFDTTEKAIEQARRLIQEGADILDIGGESTRPGSRSVGGDEELLRVMPVIEFALSMDIPVSVDTSKPEVMRATIDAGVDLVNDINALRAPGALDVVADSAVMICLMHMQGKPETMQHNPQYSDVVAEVISFLEQRVAAAVSTGIERERIIIDPGFGFGKTFEHNLMLLRGLDRLVSTNFPVLAGLSRKSMLGTITGNAVNDRVHASVAAALLAVGQGARIIRVHDVKATRDAFSVFAAVNRIAPGFLLHL